MLERRPGEEVNSVESTANRSGRASGWHLLRTRNFSLLWAGQIISQIGDGLNKVALLWFVYELTGSALKMTVIGLLQTLPPLILGPAIGVYLDRLPKKPVMIWVDLLRALLVLLIPVLHLFDELTLARLYVLVFLISIVSTVFGPALASAVPLLVSRTQLTAANALIQTTTNIGMLAGPAISGLGIALVGAQNVLYLNVATFLISALCLLLIQTRQMSEGLVPEMVRRSFLHDALVGFRFIFSSPMVFALMISSSLYSFAASAFIFLLPVFAKVHLGLGPVQLGGLWSSMGVGMLIASLWLASVQQRDFCARLRIIAGSLGIGGLAMVSLSVLKLPALVTGIMMLIGTSLALFTPITWAFLQEMTPASFMARVLTTFSTGGMFAAMLGLAFFGWATDAVGPQVSLIGTGLVFLLTAVILLQFSRHYGFPTLVEAPLP